MNHASQPSTLRFRISSLLLMATAAMLPTFWRLFTDFREIASSDLGTAARAHRIAALVMILLLYVGLSFVPGLVLEGALRCFEARK